MMFICLRRSTYTNNEFNSEKKLETYTFFSAVVGGKHIGKFTTSISIERLPMPLFTCYIFSMTMSKVYRNNQIF